MNDCRDAGPEHFLTPDLNIVKVRVIVERRTEDEHYTGGTGVSPVVEYTQFASR